MERSDGNAKGVFSVASKNFSTYVLFDANNNFFTCLPAAGSALPRSFRIRSNPNSPIAAIVFESRSIRLAMKIPTLSINSNPLALTLFQNLLSETDCGEKMIHENMV
jgi:hypothetical protein